MRRHLVRGIAAVAAGLGLGGAASAPQIDAALEASRTEGVAPLAVFFDATGTTCKGCGDPFHDLHYAWSFGDGAATWATSGRPRQRAYGPTAAHVFEQPGSYAVELQVTGQAGSPQKRTVTIRVDDPDRVWTGAKTVCISTSGSFDGCPAGARHLATDSLDQARKVCGGSAARCLFRRGEAFSGVLSLGSRGPGLIGAYGSGAKPRLQGRGKAPVLRISGATDWRVMDVEFEGATAKGSVIATASSRSRDLLVLRTGAVPATLHAGLVFSGNALDGKRQDLHDGLFLVENDWRHFGRGSGGNIAFLAAARFALLGNHFEDARRGEHIVRIQHGEKGVISSNVFADQADKKSLLTIRSRDQQGDCSGGCGRPSREIVVSDNVFRGTDDINLSITGTNKGGEVARGVNYVVERNFFTKGSADDGLQMAIKFENTDGITLRNNIVVMEDWQTYRGFEFSGNTSRRKAYNNTCYVPGATQVVVRCVRFTDAGPAEAFNNLLFAPSAQSHVVVEGDAVSGGANLTVTSNPFLAPTPREAQDFRLRAGVTAIGGGVRVPNAIDFTGSPRAAGASPDVGALVFDCAAAGLGPEATQQLCGTRAP